MDYMSLGRRIRALRREHQRTQNVFSQQVGISLSFLGHIERGSRKASIDTLVKIACVLGIGVDELLQDSLPHLYDKPVLSYPPKPKLISKFTFAHVQNASDEPQEEDPANILNVIATLFEQHGEQ